MLDGGERGAKGDGSGVDFFEAELKTKKPSQDCPICFSMISNSYGQFCGGVLLHNHANQCQFYVLSEAGKAELLCAHAGQTKVRKVRCHMVMRQ